MASEEVFEELRPGPPRGLADPSPRRALNVRALATRILGLAVTRRVHWFSSTIGRPTVGSLKLH